MAKSTVSRAVVDEVTRLADAQYTRDDFAWGIAQRTTGDWRQSSGDVSASVFGATFARVYTETDPTTGKVRKSIELVKVYNFEVDSGETLSDPEENGPYFVETYTLDPHIMGDDERVQYFIALGKMARTFNAETTVDDALIFIAGEIADYGYFEQTSHRGGQFQTLGDAMRSQDIPQSALWRADEYTARVAWGRECKYTGHLHPHTNHLAELAVEVMSYLDSGDDATALLKHMEQTAHAIEDTSSFGAADIPAWYTDNPKPCDAWRTLETF